ncbi:unnamed protein product [Cuscuta campestris]|uniref:Uncharacterized protein n=1 Tax=Cuscuta campestris TaxID=132261 RepID=A0A484L6G1_9ASTE|nr:unnamed protein product [Cuscuta campestris]
MKSSRFQSIGQNHLKHLVHKPVEREDATSRKKKAVTEESGQLCTLPAWKQKVGRFVCSVATLVLLSRILE